MRFKLEGRMGKEWEMVFHMDFSKLSQTTNVGEFPAILDAYGVYKGLKWLDISAGFQKLPYGRFSQVSFSNEIFWQRAEIARGNVYSRRDLGLVIAKDFMNERLNVSVGAFTGQGENILTTVTNGDNDPSGTFEYSGRLSYSWPKKIKTSYVIDKDYSEKPMFSVGVSGRYVNRSKSITGIADYDLKIVAGDRMLGSWDASMWWKGFNLMAEYHVGQYRPTGVDTSRLYGKNTDFFRIGGLITQVSYYSEKLHSAFALRYDSFSPNDLVR
ncbi:MAG: hypothetical protein EBX50_23555, partial [Chitinophagia bacterium]|nr:hypothetical protein [Chitinophagia bacterium]